jgi:hypothetical protein
MQTLPFNQTRAELMVRVAASIVVNGFRSAGVALARLDRLAHPPQYGYSAPAILDGTGKARMVRITDLKDGSIAWDRVPFCDCENPARYQLQANDILFARTGEGATGKTHLVRDVPSDLPTVFASYLIRVRPLEGVRPGYLYCFLQSEQYWAQITEHRRGSAQPNVNAVRLSSLEIPVVSEDEQLLAEELIQIVRCRQDGRVIDLPAVPASLKHVRERICIAEEALQKAWDAKIQLEQLVKDERLFVDRMLDRLISFAPKATGSVSP